MRGSVDATLSRLQSFDDGSLISLHQEKAIAEATVRALDAELSGGAAQEQLTSRLNALSVHLSNYSKALDIDKLTIVIDSSYAPLPLENIGSGENQLAD